MESPDPTAGMFETEGQRLRTPPAALVATGFEETVYLWLTAIVNPPATARIMEEWITMGELRAVAKHYRATGGLVAKAVAIDDAKRLRERFEAIGTKVEFVRPDEADALVRAAPE